MCPSRLNEFNKVVNHDLTLYWLTAQAGYELRRIPKTLEEELKKEREEKIARYAAITASFSFTTHFTAHTIGI